MNDDDAEVMRGRSAANTHAIEVVAERVSALEKLMNERDRRYEQAFRESREAVAAALQAAKELTHQAFIASEKAITKAETGQLQYNASHNNLTQKMDAQYKEMIPRLEAQAEFMSISEKLADLRESRSEVGGRAQGLSQGWGILLGLISLIGILFGIIAFFKH